MAITPTYNVINSINVSQNIIDLLLGIANEAFRMWGEVLAGDAEVSVRIELLEDTFSGRAQGGWGNGTNIGQHEGVNVIVGAPSYELQTGQNVSNGGHDILLQFSRDYLLNELFLKCGEKELSYIRVLGAKIGFLFGLIQMGIW